MKTYSIPCPFCFAEVQVKKEGSTMCMECSQRFTAVFIKNEDDTISVSSLETLQRSWKKDPCWEIEDAEGFGKYHDQLLAWRKEYELEYQQKEEDRITRRLRVIELVTGVTNADVGQAISTYSEIEHLVNHPNQQSEIASETIAIAQVRATLLLAAQTQRIADLMESQMEESEIDRALDESVLLYRVNK